MILELALVAQLGDSCARSVAFEMLAAGRRPDFPRDERGVATDLIVRQHHSVDLGRMQVNSGNLLASGPVHR